MKVENKIFPNEEQLKGFDDNPEIGPIKMLNLLKFKEPNGKEILSIPVDRVVSVVSRFGEIIYP